MAERDYGKMVDALLQTWPVRAAKSLASALMLPGDVYAGRVPVTGPDGRTNPAVIDRAADLAGLALGGPVAGGAPAGALGSGFVLDYFGTPVRILQNPSKMATVGFLKRTKYRAARRITDPDTGDVYLWDAADPAMHQMVAEKLGIKPDPRYYETIGLD